MLFLQITNHILQIMNLLFECFSQAFDSLLRKLHKYVPYGTSVADLYAGAGVIGLSLAATRKCRSNSDSTFRSCSSSHSSINMEFLLRIFPKPLFLSLGQSNVSRSTKNQRYLLRRQRSDYQSVWIAASAGIMLTLLLFVLKTKTLNI